jgi:cytochrome c
MKIQELLRCAHESFSGLSTESSRWWSAVDVGRANSVHVFRAGASIGLLLSGLGLLHPVGVYAADDAAAQDLAKTSGCFKCHGVDKKKDGPALRDAAAKYRGDPDAEAKLIYHVTSGEKVKFDDGHEEEHKKVKTKSSSETRNLVQWILALEGGTKR